MSPSPPFPSPVPPSHSSGASPHPGIIGEHRSTPQQQQQQHHHHHHQQQQQQQQKQQQLAGGVQQQEPPNGEYLLHLLQSGNHMQQQQHNVGVGNGERYEQQHHYSFALPGIVPGNDIPMAAWDPAVAALGPSHSFNALGSASSSSSSGGDRTDLLLPRLYPSQFNISLGSGWSTPQPQHQQQHPYSFVGSASSASSSSSISSSISSPVDLRFIQSRAPSSLYGSHVEMGQRRSIEWQSPPPSAPPLPSPPHHHHHHPPQQHHHHQPQLRGMLTECDISSNNSNNLSGNLSSSRASMVAAGAERAPHQQFYGDGAELMKLLQISSSKPGGAAAVADPKLEQQPQQGSAILGLGSQKLTPAIVHGPIGPPKRTETISNNRSSPAEDLLGRFWPAPAVPAISNGIPQQQELASNNLKSVVFPYKENQVNFGSLPSPKDSRGWWGEQQQQQQQEKKFDAFVGDSVLHPPLGNRFGATGRFYGLSKSGLPENLEYHDGRGLLGGWSGEFLEEGPNLFRNKSSNRGREDVQLYVKSIDSNSNSNSNSANHHHDTHSESPSKDSESDYSRDSNGRVSEGTRVVGARRSSGSRGEATRRGGRVVVGQWVAVNERQRDREGTEIGGGAMSEGAESGSEKGSNSTGNSCKEESLAVSKEGSGSQKARDDLKRRRGQQQEWRMKTPPTHAQTQSQAQCSSQPKISDFSSGSESPELLLNGTYRVSSPLKVRPLAAQVDHPGLPSSGVLDSASVLGCAVEDSKKMFHDRSGFHANGGNDGSEEGLAKEEEEELREAFAGYLDLVDEPDLCQKQGFDITPAQEEVDYETRQEHMREFRRHPHRSLAMPSLRPEMRYRPDLEKFTTQMLTMYQSLIPPEEEERKRRQFLSHLDQLVAREWPGARLFLFGSCANAFGVCNSDIDVCLSISDDQLSKADLVLKMAAILRSDNMQNVQALTHARVPIVKFTEVTTGISCDICVNNMLAVVNSKLLHDYSQIDVRLRQLAFLVKHWAKRRQVNETYRGTLSSYAYVLMCIHFLQQRKPAILPCLQEMRPTYRVTVGNIECSYYDQVESLQTFGAANKETLGELLTSFFEYWAFRHDYTRAVISVRTGGYLSKDEKEWTRRIGNERHLICIEDPLEVAHDLGRVVDRHSIRVLRDEFHRAAKILRHDLNPCTTLFEPFVREK